MPFPSKHFPALPLSWHQDTHVWKTLTVTREFFQHLPCNLKISTQFPRYGTGLFLFVCLLAALSFIRTMRQGHGAEWWGSFEYPRDFGVKHSSAAYPRYANISLDLWQLYPCLWHVLCTHGRVGKWTWYVDSHRITGSHMHVKRPLVSAFI